MSKTSVQQRGSDSSVSVLLVPMAAPIKTIINVVVVLAVCLWLLRVTGIVDIPMSLRR